MSPWKPKEACPVCRRVNCTDPTHSAAYRKKIYSQERRLRRPYIHEDRKRREELVAHWVEDHGYICPGFECPPHPTDKLTADHIVPVSMGGDPLGELQVLCSSCNSRRYAALRRAALAHRT